VKLCTVGIVCDRSKSAAN